MTAPPQCFQWIIICANVCTQPVFFSFFFVLQLHTDLDKGDSSVKYTLSGDGAGSIFTIDKTTGDIHALRSLDREEKPYYTLRAQAVDINTNIPLEPESEFVIKVQDINDNEPKFLEGPYTASVPEMSPVGKWPSRILKSLLLCSETFFSSPWTWEHNKFSFRSSVGATRGVKLLSLTDFDILEFHFILGVPWEYFTALSLHVHPREDRSR